MARRILKVAWLLPCLLFSTHSMGQEQVTLHELRTIENLIQTGETENALFMLEKEIGAITRTQGRYSTELIAPLILQGDAYMGQGDVATAIETYEEARSISRQHFGLQDLGQVEVLYREADAYYAANDILEANDRHEYAFSIFTNSYGTDSELILPGLFKLADWYMETQNIITARGLFERALYLSDTTSKPELVEYRMEALKNLAKTYRQERFRPSKPKKTQKFMPRPYGSLNHPDQYYAVLNNYREGERALLELVRMRMAIEEPLSIELAESKLDLADWYLLFNKHEKALIVYQDIWESLNGTTQISFLQEHMTEPVPLYQPLPTDPAADDEDSDVVMPQQGRVEYSLSVSHEGETSNIEEISLRPSFLSSKVIEETLEKSVYRPAFKNGEPVDTDNVQFVHNFYYLPKKSSGGRGSSGGTNATFRGSN